MKLIFDTSGPSEELISTEGQLDLGPAKIKDLHYASGPEQAFSVGIEYRDPKYWWFGGTVNLLAKNYISISPITRTESFKIDPSANLPFPDATDENIQKILHQKPLPEVYLLNLNMGKSWIWGKKYFNLFMSISNLLDTTFASGGYEQSRNGNYGQYQRDHLSGTPSFGPKFWFGYGRTFFINFSVSI